ncbi:hypothetical protein Tco_1175413, partial [Tanacetum coccineum]
ANQYMTYTDKELDNVLDISHLKIKVGHPNGNEAFISKIGNLKLSNGLILYDVLVILEYYVTLISVHKLAKENKVVVAFDESKCYFLIQDLSMRSVLGIGNQCLVILQNMAKQTREHFPLSDHVSSSLGELVHLDLWRPYKVSDRLKNDTANVFQDVNHINFFDVEYLEIPNDDERVDPNLNSDFRSQSDSNSSSESGNGVNTTDFIVNNSRNDADSSDDIVFNLLEDLLNKLNKNSEPKSYFEASKYSHWTDAMNQEMDALLRNEWDACVEETVIDEDEVIPEGESPELIEEFQNVDKHVPTIFDHERIEATLKDMMSNQFRDAEEYACHLEQSKNYMENHIYGNSKEKKYVLSLHKIHAVPFPKEDLEAKMNRLNDIEDMYSLCLNKKVNFCENKLLNSLMTLIRSRVIWERVHDFQLGIESYQIKINLTPPMLIFPCIKARDPYSDIPCQMHNNIMAAGSKDRPPMLTTGRYAQWQSRFLRYIDTRPKGDALRKCILEGPYQPTTVTIPAVPATENSPEVPE